MESVEKLFTQRMDTLSTIYVGNSALIWRSESIVNLVCRALFIVFSYTLLIKTIRCVNLVVILDADFSYQTQRLKSSIEPRSALKEVTNLFGL